MFLYIHRKSICLISLESHLTCLPYEFPKTAIRGKSTLGVPATTHTHTPLTVTFGICSSGREPFDFVCLQKLCALWAWSNSAKSFETFLGFFFFFYISKLETWGEIKGQNIQWKGRWVLTFGKEGFLRVTSESPRWGDKRWPRKQRLIETGRQSEFRTSTCCDEVSWERKRRNQMARVSISKKPIDRW